MEHAFAIVAGALLSGTTSWALGQILLLRLRLALATEERHLLGLAAGAAIHGWLLFLLGITGLCFNSVFVVLGMTASAAAWRCGAFRRTATSLPPLPRPWRWIFLGVYVPFAVVALGRSLSFEAGPGGSSDPLALMARSLGEHRMVSISGPALHQLPQGIDLLLLPASALGGHAAAATTYCLFSLALPLLMVCFGRRFAAPRAGVFAALLTFASPVVAIAAAGITTDVATLYLLFALFYLAELSLESPRAMGLPLGIVAGGCMAATTAGVLAIPYAAFALGRARLRHKQPAVGAAAGVVGVGLCVAAPWLFRTVWLSGAAAAPLLYSIVPDPSAFAFSTIDLLRHSGWRGLRELAMELCVRGQPPGGPIGPIFLIAPLSLFALRSRLGRRALLTGALFTMAFLVNASARAFMPALPFVSLALAFAVPESWVRTVLPAAIAFHAVSCWYAVLPLYGSHPRTGPFLAFAVRSALPAHLYPDPSLTIRDVTSD